VEDYASEEKVGEGAFRTDVVKIGLVLGIALDAQASRQNEGPNARDEPREEWVEGKSADETTVKELNRARNQDVTHIGVDEFEFCGRRRGVVFDEAANDAE